MFLQIIIILKNNGNSVWILGTPVHGNLGDQAILNSEIKILLDMGKKNIIYVESSFVRNNINFLKRIIGKKPLYIHGGGFLGSIWPNEEFMVRSILENFKNNEIILFPQTIYFEKLDQFFFESKQVYECCQNAIFMCREKYSYEFMKKNMKKCKCILVPDMVLYNDTIQYNFERKDCLFCIRNDREKINYSFNEAINILKKYNLKINYTDTIIKDKVFFFNRDKLLRKKLMEFSKYKIIITDRLHGMLFCYITRTPCLFLENTSYKVKGTYDWLRDCNYIKMYNSETFERDLNELLNTDNYKTVNLKNEFEKIRNIIN